MVKAIALAGGLRPALTMAAGTADGEFLACGLCLRTTGRGARPRVPRILLVELADEHARPAFTTVDIDIPLTQQVLASLIASSRSGVDR
jgi:hypothetical protein